MALGGRAAPSGAPFDLVVGTDLFNLTLTLTLTSP